MERILNWLMIEWSSRDYYLILVTMSLFFMAVSLIVQLINKKSRALDFSALSVVACIFSIIAMMFFGSPSITYALVVTMTLLATGTGVCIATDNASYFIQFFDDNHKQYKIKNTLFCVIYFALILGSSYLVI